MMINSRGLGAATVMALILVLAARGDGLAQYKINERNERTNVLPRPPMRAYQPGTIVTAPAASPYRNVTPVPPAAANRIGDHDGERGAFAAGVAAGVVLGGAIAAPGIYYVPAPSPADDPVAYCMQMYSSYDPQSGTYIGDDGTPHPCP
jgi:hypothetical protein